MSFRVGVGIVTFNRREILSGTIDQVRALTRQPDAALVVADDGSTDGTLAMLRDKQLPVITGVNMGIAWNKNRALFLLAHVLGCDTVILLEDDTRPECAGWETEWIAAAERWGHANYARDFMRDRFVSGDGTAIDPYLCKDVTAQCACFSSEALTYGGYLDPRFKGYGYEHAEHSRRLVRVGYGGKEQRVDGEQRVQFYLINGHTKEVSSTTHQNAEQEERNLQLARELMGVQGYRSPWGEDNELRQFRSEIEGAMGNGPDRFRLTPAAQQASMRRPVGRSLFSRLFNRS